jgi:hypothetical protein
VRERIEAANTDLQHRFAERKRLVAEHIIPRAIASLLAQHRPSREILRQPKSACRNAGDWLAVDEVRRICITSIAHCMRRGRPVQALSVA